MCCDRVPFLRACAKFYESMTGVSPPSGFALELGGGEIRFEELLGYLDLPKSFQEVFDSPAVLEMMMR